MEPGSTKPRLYRSESGTAALRRPLSQYALTATASDSFAVCLLTWALALALNSCLRDNHYGSGLNVWGCWMARSSPDVRTCEFMSFIAAL